MEEREGVKEAMEERKEEDGRKVEEQEEEEEGECDCEERDRREEEKDEDDVDGLQARDTRETSPSGGCCCVTSELYFVLGSLMAYSSYEEKHIYETSQASVHESQGVCFPRPRL